MEKRIVEIDRASGIAIILVVFGHMYFPVFEKIEIYDIARSFVYKIHMPLFMTLSGFLAFYSYSQRQISANHSIKVFIINKLKKFLPPFLFFPALAIIADIVIKHITPQQVSESVYSWFLMPKSGSAGFVWYLYVLFIFYCILPLIFNLKKEILFFTFIASFFLTNIDSTPLFSTDLVFRYFFFFLGGGLISMNYEEFKNHIRAAGWLYTLLFVIISVLDFNMEFRLPFQLLSILFILTILFLTGISIKRSVFDPIALLGRNTFVIYLFSSMIMNTVYLAVNNYIREFPNPVSMALIFLCGLLLPLPVRYFFNKIIPPSVYRL
jgi:peptidoglycan/LPS O-acetylase OafA/YrhL